ncbi:transposase [Streptomyces noursei]|uniref:transposase n=1 Tax=Streptomyces noursei TaxID=1971 RepID=UPI0023B7B999|nr:transposase [Streptomyces noursei]
MPDGICRRRSARRPPPRTAASRYGSRPARGVGCTGRCSTNSGPGARWTRPRRSSTRPRSRQKRGGSPTGPNPVDRGKKGSERHVLSDAQGIPLAVAASGANMHDSLALKALIRGIPAVRSRPGPRRRQPVKLRADKAYFSAEHLA